MDRRVKYTKKIIKDTLLELMENKDISKITVTEICEIADINRATFYKYYLDVYDLLNQIENELIEKIRMTLKIEGKTLETIIFDIMKIIEENEDICTVLLSENSNKDFLLNILYYARDISYEVCKKLSDYDENTFNYVFMYSANGVLSIIQLWLKNGCNETPEKITELICKIIRKGNNAFI